MPNRYNYSISLIRRRNNSWVIEPEDATTHVFAQELSGKKVGDGYLASKKEGELSYCIFLSGGVCLGVYGWIITMNGWQIVDLKTYLQIAQEVWKVFDQASLKERDIRLILHALMEAKGLIAYSSPARIDRNVEVNDQTYRFTPAVKPPASSASSSSKKKNRRATWITGGIDTIGDMFGGCMSWVIYLACIGAVFNKCKGGTSKDNAADSVVAVDTAVVDSVPVVYAADSIYYADSTEVPIDTPSKADRVISKSTKKQSSRSTTPRRTRYHYDDDIDDNSGLEGAY